MQTKTLLLTAVLLLAGTAAVWMLVFDRGAAPAAVPVAGAGAGEEIGALAAGGAPAERPQREDLGAAGALPAAAELGALEDDPAIRAALAGFRGRVVDPQGAPQPDLAVVLFRFAPDSLFGGIATATDEGPLEPDIDAGSTRTGVDGTFSISGVWPRAFFLLQIGLGGDVSRSMVVDRTPAPGEVVDLGDIVLDPCGILTGVVQDEDGQPVAGAAVRALDVPGAIVAFVPLEQIDPRNVVIVRDGDTRLVVECPAWLARRWDSLPVPMTETGADGSFRLGGVPPGSVMVAAYRPGLQGWVNPRVVVKAGEERDLGLIELREGEEAFGKVLDTTGQPIAGAEVVVGQVLPMGPVALGSYAEPTDTKGQFSLTGLRGGRVLAAARRSPGDPWVVGEPEPVTRDLILTLPAQHDLTLRLLSQAGEPVGGARLRLLPDLGDEDGGALIAERFGVFPRVALEPRLQEPEAGVYQVAGLDAAAYQVEVRVAGFERTTFRLQVDRDLEHTVRLAPAVACAVRVLDGDAVPVRNAAVYSFPQGGAEDVPRYCGRTSKAGALQVEDLAEGDARLQAFHPAHGWVGAEVVLPRVEPATLQFQKPGILEGQLLDRGGPPPVGMWMVAVARNSSADDDPGNGMNIPRLSTPDADGNYRVAALQPGTYSIVAIQSLRAVRSFGSLYEMMIGQAMMGGGGGPRNDTVVVVSDQTAHHSLDVTEEERVVEGPSARITGTVLVNGRPGQDLMVASWSSGAQMVELDENGRFDLGQLEAGSRDLRVLDRGEGSMMFGSALYERQIEVVADQDQDLVIDVAFGAVRGRVFDADGNPMGRCPVQLEGQSADGEATAEVQLVTDARGVFQSERVPAGRYSVEARTESGRGQGQVEVVAGLTGEVELRLSAVYSVRGTVDFSAAGVEAKPEWFWVEFEPVDGGDSESGGGDELDSSFEVDGLSPGDYRVSISLWFRKAGGENEWEGDTREYQHPGVVQVRGRDLEGVVLRAVPKPDEPGPESHAEEAHGK